MYNETLIALLLLLVACVVTMVIYPYVLSFAIRHQVVDNPDVRKLQRVPVPVMGGTCVFAGMIVPAVVAFAFLKDVQILYIMGLLSIMYLTGLWDDRKDVYPGLRLIIETLVVWFIILVLHIEIPDFHGFLGIHQIPATVSLPLSIVAGVGIMNAVNLIDGVDGYCSSYGIMACTSFAVIFHMVGDTVLMFLALSVIGALIPFFFHNVFGKCSKMFLGDSGSLMLGTVLTIFVFAALSMAPEQCIKFDGAGLSLVGLTLAILAVPVFDTLRVMTARMICGKSPFHPDKTHLHHLFIEMNFPPLPTTGIIVTCNLMIILLDLLAWKLGASGSLQVFLVILLSLCLTCVFYYYMEGQHKQNDGQGSDLYRKWCKFGFGTRMSGRKWWRAITRAVDSRLLAGKEIKTEK